MAIRYVIKKGNKYISDAMFEKEYATSIEKAFLWFTKKDAKEECYDENERVIKVNVQVTKLED